MLELKHLAVIMDGNGRWASLHKLPKIMAYQKGANAAHNLIQLAIKHGIKHLTLFAFSTENWKRAPNDVSILVSLLQSYLKQELNNLHKHGVKLKIIGNLSKLNENILKDIEKAEKFTCNNSTLNLYIAFSYSGRGEILHACQKIINMGIKPEDVDEQLFKTHLYSPCMPDVDLLIRTSGECRISNFLLWQIAYSELYFTETYWPDFCENNLIEAIDDFNKRIRTFGKTRK